MPLDSHRGIQEQRAEQKGRSVSRRWVLGAVAAAGTVGGTAAVTAFDPDDGARDALRDRYDMAVEVTDGFVARAAGRDGSAAYDALVADMATAYEDRAPDGDLYLGGDFQTSGQGTGYAWDGRVFGGGEPAEVIDREPAFTGTTYGEDRSRLLAAVDDSEQWSYDDSGILPFHW